MPTAEEWAIVGLSARVALAAVAGLFVPGVLLGWVLARCRFPGKVLLDTLVNLPLVLPPVVTGYLLLLLVGRRGLLGPWLESWFGLHLAFSFHGAALAAAVMALPLLVRPVRAAIELVDPTLEDAARGCGAGRFAVLMRVTLPLAFPGVLAGCVLAFARALGEFGATITLAGAIPGESRTLPVAIHGFLQSPGGDGPALRLVLLSLALSISVLAISEWLARRSGIARK